MLPDNEPWEDRAACVNHPDTDWFSSEQAEKYDARAVCQSECPVRRECIELALTEKRIFGVWGGVDEYEIRRALCVDAFGVASARARPPRCPYCLSSDLDISGTKTAQGYRTQCKNDECRLTWHIATIPAKYKQKRTR